MSVCVYAGILSKFLMLTGIADFDLFNYYKDITDAI